MEYKELGTTGVKVSTICLGTWAMSGDSTWGPQDEADAIQAIEKALDLGVNFIDTAEAYGNGASEELLGRVLQGRRDKVVIATKVSSSHLRAGDVKKACENSLRRLRTDYIDLYYIHWPTSEVPLDETYKALEELKKEGKVRFIGVSNFGSKDLDNLFQIGRAEANQLPYSLLWRAIEYDIQDACIENNVSIMCYSPLAQGLLTGKFSSPDEVPVGRARTRFFSGDRPMSRHGERGAEAETFATIKRIREICSGLDASMTQVSLAWVLSRPGVCSVIVGARNASQVEHNVKAVDLKLSLDVLTSLTEATEELKTVLGPNPDMFQSDSRYNVSFLSSH